MHHGKIQTRLITAGEHRVLRNETFCSLHGWIDNFHCADFNAEHGQCRPVDGCCALFCADYDVHRTVHGLNSRTA